MAYTPKPIRKKIKPLQNQIRLMKTVINKRKDQCATYTELFNYFDKISQLEYDIAILKFKESDIVFYTLNEEDISWNELKDYIDCKDVAVELLNESARYEESAILEDLANDIKISKYGLNNLIDDGVNDPSKGYTRNHLNANPKDIENVPNKDKH